MIWKTYSLLLIDKQLGDFLLRVIHRIIHSVGPDRSPQA
jgi:hypothetical protein